MTTVDIKIRNIESVFFVGDTVTGTAEVTLPELTPLSDVCLSFHCLGEVKWIEYQGSVHYHNGHVYFERKHIHDEQISYKESDVIMETLSEHKKVLITFSFTIPRDKNLPSTMVCNYGFIQYFVRVTIGQLPLNRKETNKYIRELVVLSPIEDHLMISVCGTAEKCILLHGGNVSMHVYIERKGFAPEESVHVRVVVNNQSNASLTPRVSLKQVQIFNCRARQKSVETLLGGEPILGAQIEGHSEVEEVIKLKIGPNEPLSLRTGLIAVKYYVHVTLDVPHSFDLHVNLPIVLSAKKIVDTQLTAKKVINQLRG